MKNKQVFLILFLFQIVLISAQVNYNLSIEELFSLGLENSTKIKASEINTSIYQEKESLAKTEKLPYIGFSLANGYVGDPLILDKNLAYIKHSNFPDWKQNYSIELSQPIYQGGKIKNTIKSASIEKEIADLGLEKDKADIKLILIKNYLELFRLYKQKEVLAENIAEAEKRLHNIENLKKEGIVTNNDVLRSQIVLSNYQLSLSETENDIAIISQQLTIVLGLDETNIIVPDTVDLDKKLNVDTEEFYVRQGYEKFPELRMSSLNIKKAQLSEKIIKSKFLPIISLNAGNTLIRPITSTNPAQDLFMNSWAVTLGLSYNISSWFDHKHTLNEAKYAINLQENIKEQTEQTIRLNVKSAYIKHQEVINRLEVLEKTVEQAKENYRVTKNKYFNQLAILTDLLDASSVQLDTELQLTTAQANYIYTYYLLLNASGNL